MNPFKPGDKIKCYDSKFIPVIDTITLIDGDAVSLRRHPDELFHYKTCELVKEPREFWVNEYECGVNIWEDKMRAFEDSGKLSPQFIRTIHVREVTPVLNLKKK